MRLRIVISWLLTTLMVIEWSGKQVERPENVSQTKRQCLDELMRLNNAIVNSFQWKVMFTSLLMSLPD